jgi:hypothetical protein
MDGTVREFNQAQQTILPLTPKWGESGRLVLGYPTDGTDGGSVAPQAEKKKWNMHIYFSTSTLLDENRIPSHTLTPHEKPWR